MNFKIIFLSFIFSFNSYALLPPMCNFEGIVKEYGKKGDKTKVTKLKLPVNNETAQKYAWSYFDFKSKGKLIIRLSSEGRHFKAHFKSDDGSLKKLNLINWINASIPKKDFSRTSLSFEHWYNKYDYCIFTIESLKAYK